MQRAGISASLGEVGRAEGGEEVDVIDEEEFAWLTQVLLYLPLPPTPTPTPTPYPYLYPYP